MKKRSFFLISLPARSGAIASAILAISGIHYMPVAENATSPFAFLTASRKEHKLQYVGVNNLVVSFSYAHFDEYCLLQALTLTSHYPLRSQWAENSLPISKDSPVNISGSLTAGELPRITLTELRELMLKRYQSGLNALNLAMAFADFSQSKRVMK
ncbi:hypothetical protein LU631_05835 [Erwinia tracheiphila]|nr:hypothetical protein [Erwinia tracheiphila]UIA88852.1 hypothetical protein LU631_05835 [Erwinia tracheiphila]UIA97233.1 hypothetical protein LU633_04505 [Erwinia tracheiphila]